MQSLNQNLNVLQSIVGIFLQSMHTPQKVIDILSRMGVTVLSLSAEFHCAIHALVHTVSKSKDMLVHLTSGLPFPLQHSLNLSTVPIKGGWKDLLQLHPDSLNVAGSSHRDCCNLWKMLCNLINYSPLYFHQFKDQLGDPERVDSISIVKTLISTAHAMHLSNSTVFGNISIEDPDEIDDPNILDMSEYIILFHSDLGSGEYLQAVQQ
ncbi:hypothetical protein BDR06DRAFT_982577 [Suillus hirtellus]|nr:hypothetical protein BDR06DRAFT_982577 [Suillus hirtellus]